MTTQYTQLKTGGWGLRGKGGPPQAGAQITVTKKDGSTKTEVVGKVLWSGEGAWIATIAAEGSTPKPSSGGRSSPSSPVPGRKSAFRTGGMGGRGGRCKASGCSGTAVRMGYCESCAFDEFDD